MIYFLACHLLNRLHKIAAFFLICDFLFSVAARNPSPTIIRNMRIFDTEKKRRKENTNMNRVVHGSITLLMTAGGITLFYLQRNTAKDLRQNQGEINGITQQTSLLQTQKKNIAETQNQLQEEKGNLEEEKGQLQKQNDDLKKQNGKLEEQICLSSFKLNINENKIEKLHQRKKVAEVHKATGCQKDQFERWCYHTKKAHKNSIKIHFYRFRCDVCRKEIPISYLANGLALYHCTNYNAHEDKGGFHVCRSCATGKKEHRCSRCDVPYTKVFPYEKESLCLICVGYDTQLATFKEIMATAKFDLSIIMDSDDGFSEHDTTKLYSKKMIDSHRVEELEYKINRYSKRYTYPLGSSRTFKVMERVKDTLKAHKDDIGDYEEILGILQDSQNVKVISTPFCGNYSWERITSNNSIPFFKQSLRIFLIKSDDKTYLILEEQHPLKKAFWDDGNSLASSDMYKFLLEMYEAYKQGN